MDDKGIACAHLLGFSDGGNIALTFALRYPERIGCLILNGANLYPGGVKRRYQLPIEFGYRAASYASRHNPDAVQNAEMLGLMVNEPQIDPNDLAALQMPTLVIAGTNDMIKTSHTRLISSMLPNAELCLMRGDHFIAAKHPGEFNARVLRFLQQNENIY